MSCLSTSIMSCRSMFSESVYQCNKKRKKSHVKKIKNLFVSQFLTSMHYSRMRTAGLLTISCSIRGEGVCPGGICPGCLSREMSAWGCLPGGCVYPSMQWGRHQPPTVNRITDRYKNITLPQPSFAVGKYFLTMQM